MIELLSELDRVKWLFNYGVGAIIGLVIFYYYRRDRVDGRLNYAEQQKQFIERMQSADVRHEKTEERFSELASGFQKSLDDNTKALGELRVALVQINGRLKA